MSLNIIAKTNTIILSTEQLQNLNLKLRNYYSCTQEKNLILQKNKILWEWNKELINLNNQILKRKYSWWDKYKVYICLIGGFTAGYTTSYLSIWAIKQLK